MAEEDQKLNMTPAPLDPDKMFAELEEKIRRNCPNVDLARVRAAYEMARGAHEGPSLLAKWAVNIPG